MAPHTERSSPLRATKSILAPRLIRALLVLVVLPCNAVTALAQGSSPTNAKDAHSATAAIAPATSLDRDLARASALLDEHRVDAARSLLKKRKDEGVTDARLESLLGRAGMAATDYPEAARSYQRAAELDPSEPNLFDYGTALFHLQHAAAITILRYGIQRYPQSVQLRVALGTALYADGNYVDGATILCDAQDLAPGDPHPMEILADTEIIPAELLPRVTALLEALSARFPRDGLLLFDLTMARSGRWSHQPSALPESELTAALQRATTLSPTLHQAFFQLGLLAGERGDVAGQIRLLRKAADLAPEREAYHYRLASAYQRAGDDPSAARERELYRSLHEKNQTVR